MLEYEKYNELQAKSQRMQEDYENQLRELEKSKQSGLEELTEFYEAKLRETCARLEQVPLIPLCGSSVVAQRLVRASGLSIKRSWVRLPDGVYLFT